MSCPRIPNAANRVSVPKAMTMAAKEVKSHSSGEQGRQHEGHRPFRQERLPAADPDGHALAPFRADFGRCVPQSGVHCRVDEDRSQESAHDRQEGDVERGQPEGGVLGQRPVGHSQQGDRIRALGR
jgi:hypothetical protein